MVLSSLKRFVQNQAKCHKPQRLTNVTRLFWSPWRRPTGASPPRRGVFSFLVHQIATTPYQARRIDIAKRPSRNQLICLTEIKGHTSSISHDLKLQGLHRTRMNTKLYPTHGLDVICLSGGRSYPILAIASAISTNHKMDNKLHIYIIYIASQKLLTTGLNWFLHLRWTRDDPVAPKTFHRIIRPLPA
jgi:hypothetical protein